MPTEKPRHNTRVVDVEDDHVLYVQHLVGVIQDMASELLQIERHCPCGARPETPATHPHAPRCPVKRALDIWENAFRRPVSLDGEQ